MIAASDMVNSGRKPELLHRNPDEDIPETSDFLPIYKTTAMRTSLTGLDIPTARRLQLATLPLVLQFVWAASTSQDMKEAFFLTLANFVIIASLLPSAAGVWWLIRRARFFLGKSNSPKPCSQTTIWNWVVALSVRLKTHSGISNRCNNKLPSAT